MSDVICVSVEKQRELLADETWPACGEALPDDCNVGGDCAPCDARVERLITSLAVVIPLAALLREAMEALGHPLRSWELRDWDRPLVARIRAALAQEAE